MYSLIALSGHQVTLYLIFLLFFPLTDTIYRISMPTYHHHRQDTVVGVTQVDNKVEEEEEGTTNSSTDNRSRATIKVVSTFFLFTQYFPSGLSQLSGLTQGIQTLVFLIRAQFHEAVKQEILLTKYLCYSRNEWVPAAAVIIVCVLGGYLFSLSKICLCSASICACRLYEILPSKVVWV